MSRVICPECGKQMRCQKNSMNIIYPAGTVFSGDYFACDCGNAVVLTANEPMPDGMMNPASIKYDVLMKADQ